MGMPFKQDKPSFDESFSGENQTPPLTPGWAPSGIPLPSEPSSLLTQDPLGEAAAEPASPPAEKAAWYMTGLSIGLILGLTALAIVFRDDLRDLESFGYAGAFVISIMSGGTVVVPVPGLPVIFALGGVLPFPFLVGIAAGLGEGLGSFNFYMAGRGGRSLVTEKHRRNRFFSKVDGWMTRRGGLTLFLASAIFNPLFSVVAATAGLMRMSPWKFYLFCAAGKAVKGTYVAYLGAFGLGFVLDRLGIAL